MLTTERLHALRRRASSVYDDETMQRSRSAARALLPAIHALARSKGQTAMHAIAAELVGVDPSLWDRHGSLGRLAARLAISAGVEHVRGALAFWATEHDPQVWRMMLTSAERLPAGWTT